MGTKEKDTDAVPVRNVIQGNLRKAMEVNALAGEIKRQVIGSSPDGGDKSAKEPGVCILTESEQTSGLLADSIINLRIILDNLDNKETKRVE